MYIVGGCADDPEAARAAYIGKEIEMVIPNSSVTVQLCHPKEWPAVLENITRQYDFSGYAPDFRGPLIWTPTGELVGSTEDFYRKIYEKKYGLSNEHVDHRPTAKIYEEIAEENMNAVLKAEERRKEGPPFSEKYFERLKCAQEQGWISAAQDFSTRKILEAKAPANFEVKTSADLRAAYDKNIAFTRSNKSDEQPAPFQRIPSKMVFAEAGGELSHWCALHPWPIQAGQISLLPKRTVTGIESLDENQNSELQEVEVTKFKEKLNVLDFSAVAEVLKSMPNAVCTFQDIGGAEEFRDPIDTYISVFHMTDYPTKCMFDRGKSLPQTSLQQHDGTASKIEAALSAGKKAVNCESSDGFSVLVAANWALVAKIRVPTTKLQENTWALLPPMPPCAYLGILVVPTLELHWPESCGIMQDNLVMSLAEVEEIVPPGDSAFEPRISRRILERPLDLLALW